MKYKSAKLITVLFIAVGVSACGGSPKQKTQMFTLSPTVNISKLTVNLRENHTADIEYHTQQELQKLVSSLIQTKMKDKNLLSNYQEADNIEVEIEYFRRFIGGGTKIASDSLAYPNFSFKINLHKDQKVKTIAARDRLTYNGGFVMNLQVISGTLRDKSYEIDFAEAISNTVVNEIEEMID